MVRPPLCTRSYLIPTVGSSCYVATPGRVSKNGKKKKKKTSSRYHGKQTRRGGCTEAPAANYIGCCPGYIMSAAVQAIYYVVCRPTLYHFRYAEELPRGTKPRWAIFAMIGRRKLSTHDKTFRPNVNPRACNVLPSKHPTRFQVQNAQTD